MTSNNINGIAKTGLCYIFRSGKGLFDLKWLENGAVAIKASNGRYLMARMNGSLYAVSDEVTDKEKFTLVVLNKPKLVLKCEHGFVGLKSASSPRFECNRATYDTLRLHHQMGKEEFYHLQSEFISV